MIVAYALDLPPRPLLVLGLSHDELSKMTDGEGLRTSLEPYGIQFDVVVISGPSDEQISEALQRDFGARRVDT